MRRKLIFAALIACLVSPASAQETRPGIGVDAHGQAVIDPTKNVLDLVLAAVKRLDDLIAENTRRLDEAHASQDKFQNAMRDAETRRIDQLAAQKQTFDLELARILRANSDASSLLLATQLKEVKTDLSDRTAKLEQFRWESGGSVTGRGDVIGWVMAALMFLVALASVAIAFIALQRSKRASV
jgi:hypothetical protein